MEMETLVNYDVELDFVPSRDIREMMDECERLDRAGKLGAYLSAAEFLTDTLAKEAYRCGDITRAQWEQIERRYPQ